MKKAKEFNELVMFQHTVFSLPFIFMAMVVAANGWFGWKLFTLGLFAAVTARNFAMSFNRYIDRRFDRENPRTRGRPSVDGRLRPGVVLFFTVLNALFFIAVSFYINELAFYLALPFLGVLAFYSYVKRFSATAHLFLGLALGLAPIAGAVAVTGSVPVWSVLLAGGVLFWVAGFDLLYALQDMAYDKERGLHSVPAKFGLNKTLWISRGFHLLSILFWGAFIGFSPALSTLSLVGLLAASLMLVWEQTLVHRGLENINRAFFTVNGYLGFIFLFFVVLDLL
jgi:4-hydroxybenzoate polyprenyltransferase